MPGPYKWQHQMCGHVARWTVPRLAERYHFAVKDHNIEFLGLCKNCQPKNL
jgi:Fe2+ or Zn2+ uptake regulation protein